VSDRPAALRPKDAASLIVVDRSGPEVRMLMGKRHASHRFMPNVFVFPGGRVDAPDHRTNLGSALHPALRQSLLVHVSRPSARLPEALIAAALRESEEEAGLHFSGGSGTMAFLATGALRFVARAVTPTFMPRRFDARFFMIDRNHVALQRPDIATPESELTELVWVTIEQALMLELQPITRLLLDAMRPKLLDPHDNAPIPFYRERRGVRFNTPIALSSYTEA
jgi:8-oxo-dGTP pyrophosphatase MutT (NUDIX family)